MAKAMGKLIALVPFWCIESWLYQATSLGVRYCEERHCRQHHSDFQEWERDRGALDEVERPKDAMCFADAHNLELAQRFPIGPVCDAQKSLTKAVHSLLACDELIAALARTTPQV